MVFPRFATNTVVALRTPIGRRSFFTYAGTSALLLASCQKQDATPGATDVGSGDIGVLNLVYALEQLEATFYAKVLAGDYFSSLATTSAEYQIFSDLALHEQVHADFFRTVLSTKSLKTLNTTLNDQIDFSKGVTVAGSGKLGVLNAARFFEDLGVATYNGVARFVTTADYLVVLGKIVSVEARHAALIRDLLVANDFIGSDIIDSTSRLERTLAPTDALLQLNTYLAADSQLTATKLV